MLFDAITAAPLTVIDLHCCEKLTQRWVNADDVGPPLNQHWTGTPNLDKDRLKHGIVTISMLKSSEIQFA